MPLASAQSVLAGGLQPLFTPGTVPATTFDAAQAWAQAYVDYVVAGGIPGKAKEAVLGGLLLQAFQPALMGAGMALLLQALTVFWIGMPVPAQAGTVTVFVPIHDLAITVPDNATPADQAQALATRLHSLTMGSTKVQLAAPPNPIVPIA